jgi:hypothetical protein
MNETCYLTREEVFEKYETPKQIYIFSTSDGCVKVGVSKDATSRIKNISLISGKKVVEYHITGFCSNAFQVESEIKKLLKDYHKAGEWFVIRFHKAVEVAEEIFKKYAVLTCRDKEAEKRRSAECWEIFKAFAQSDFQSQKEDKKIKNLTLLEAEEILKYDVEVCIDTCGEDDELCTIPALKAYEALKNVIEHIEEFMKYAEEYMEYND